MAVAGIGVNCQGGQSLLEPIAATETVAPVQKYVGQDTAISWNNDHGQTGIVWLELLAPPSPGDIPIRLLVFTPFVPLVPNPKNLLCHDNLTVTPIEMTATFDKENEFTAYAFDGGCPDWMQCSEETWTELRIQGTIIATESTLWIDTGMLNTPFEETPPAIISNFFTATLTAVPLSQPPPFLTCQGGFCQLEYEAN